jgi:Mg-chelatase subunit ChlD
MIGKKIHKKASHYGDKEDVKGYRKGDRYRDIALKKTIKTSIRRGHKEIHQDDLKVFERQSRGGIYVVYGMDASGSMKGKKIEMAKKAGIALAFKAIEDRDNVGLLVFGTKVREAVFPSLDFGRILESVTKVRAAQETNIVKMIEEAITMFPKKQVTKHLLILSDALPTIGKDPEEETLKAISEARAAGITVSLIGIDLDAKGKKLGEKIVQLGEGRLYQVKNLDTMDTIVLEDYYSVI